MDGFATKKVKTAQIIITITLTFLVDKIIIIVQKHHYRNGMGGDGMEQTAKTSPRWIRGIRCAYGYSQEYLAEQLGISVSNYRKKESGIVGFSDSEKIIVARVLNLNQNQVNDIFFGGMFPKD